MHPAQVNAKNMSRILAGVLLLLSALFLALCMSQTSQAQSLDLTINDCGLSFGNSKRLNGVRSVRDKNA